MVQRYYFDTLSGEAYPESDGDWVEYADYEELRTENEGLKESIKDLLAILHGDGNAGHIRTVMEIAQNLIEEEK